MRTILLVPGHWLGAWTWEEVSERLSALGHWPMWSRPADLAQVIAAVSSGE